MRLAGSPCERGKSLGEELGDEIRSVLALWRRELFVRFAVGEQSDSDAAVASWTARFVTGFLASAQTGASAALLERWAPAVLEELHGMAEGAAVSYDELLALQLRDELDRYGTLLSGSGSGSGGRRREEVSTSVAVCGLRKTGCPALLGQTAELEPSRSLHRVVLELSGAIAADTGCIFLGHAGQIAPLSGINACGVAVVADLLPQLAACSDSGGGGGGLCAGFVVRAVLAQSSFDAALHALLDMPHASGCCFTLGGPDGRVAVVEASGNPPPLMLLPPKPGSFIAHTNHPLEHDDFDPEQEDEELAAFTATAANGETAAAAAAAAAAHVDMRRGWDSTARLSRIEEYLSAELPSLRGQCVGLLGKVQDALVRSVAFAPPSELRTHGLCVLVCGN
jgi:hypothetical protein